MIFLVLSRSRKMIFLFAQKYDLTPRRKMKDDISQKDTRKYKIIFKCSEEMVFWKKVTLGYDLCCTIWKGGIFFEKAFYFSLGGKYERDDLFQEIHGNIFFIRHVPRPPAKKVQLRSYPAKTQLKVIETLDHHLRKSSIDSLSFHRDICRRFHILLSSGKKQKLNI